MASLQVLSVGFGQELLHVQLMEETLADFTVGPIGADEEIAIIGGAVRAKNGDLDVVLLDPLDLFTDQDL
jgi:hypothetical protein